ncbi:MAG: RibD family protein [Candidatus Sericytochromatia bacterium]|nr:RibD family protein [Candidatus Sericytochromatia bacterium]
MTHDPNSLLSPDQLAWADTFASQLHDAPRPDRPAVVMKLAMTLDGKIAVASGESRWISGEASRTLVHVLRSRLGAVMVGAGTVLADDPLLNVRLSGWPPARRILVHGRRPWPAGMAAYGDPAPLIVATPTPEAVPAVSRPDHAIWGLDDGTGQVDLPGLLRRLKSTGTDVLLLEGGSRLNGAMLAAGLVDHVLIFIAPKLAGEGPTPIQGWSLDRMADAVQLQDMTVRPIGDDLLIHGVVQPRPSAGAP